MEISTTLCLIITVISLIILPVLFFIIKNKDKKNIFVITVFCCYLIVLFFGVFGKISITSQSVKIALDFSGEWCAKPVKLDFFNLLTFDVIVNIIMLIPVGLFVYYFLYTKIKNYKLLIFLILLGFICGLFIELMQFILPIPRFVFLSDIIFNTISVCIGGLLGLVFKLLLNKVKND